MLLSSDPAHPLYFHYFRRIFPRVSSLILVAGVWSGRAARVSALPFRLPDPLLFAGFFAGLVGCALEIIREVCPDS